MALTSLSDLKSYLNISNLDEDTYLGLLKAGVEEAFKGLVGWTIESANYTEYYDGTGTPFISLRQCPVTAITSVSLDSNGYAGQGSGAFPSTTLQTAGRDYYLQLDRSAGGSGSGLLVRIGAVWPNLLERRRGDLSASRISGMGNIKVAYTAGYTTIPADIQLAIFEACKELRASRTAPGAVQSEGLGEYNVSVGSVQLPQQLLKIGRMEQIVARYRRVRLR